MDKKAAKKFPELILETDFLSLWYKKNHKFKVPRAQYFVKIYTIDLGIQFNVENLLFVEIWKAMFKSHINEIVYQAEMADLQFKIELEIDGFRIKFTGFNDSIPPFFETILKLLFEYDPSDDHNLFAIQYQKLNDDYFNSFN